MTSCFDQFVLLAAGLFAASCMFGPAASASETSLEVGSFGKLALYAPSPQPAHVVLFLSGDGGWN